MWVQSGRWGFEQAQGWVARKVGCNWIPVDLGLVHSFILERKGAVTRDMGLSEALRSSLPQAEPGEPPESTGLWETQDTHLQGTKTVKSKVPLNQLVSFPFYR